MNPDYREKLYRRLESAAPSMYFFLLKWIAFNIEGTAQEQDEYNRELEGILNLIEEGL